MIARNWSVIACSIVIAAPLLVSRPWNCASLAAAEQSPADGLNAAADRQTSADRDINLSEPEHWSFRRLNAGDVPRVEQEANCRTDCDRFLLAGLQSKGLTFNPEADRATLIRRVSFDLTGLPPTLEELAIFLSDSEPDAYERMVERYLASLHYGERWGKHWLDIAGYADSNGYFDSDTERPLAYRYRDYVIRSINNDKPFDRFIREQLAGDQLAKFSPAGEPTAESIELLEATHFLRNAQDGTADSNGNEVEVLRDRHAVLDATVEIFGSALFGLTLQCARCHDHKFEPVTQRDYYALQAVLAPAFDTKNWVVPTERYVMMPNSESSATSSKGSGRATDSLPSMPDKIAIVKDVSATPPDVFILEQGDFLSPGEKVRPAGLEVLSSPDNSFSTHARATAGPSTGYRLAFAKWLTQPDSRPAALLARVHVNRIWQHIFGRGLAPTPGNLGVSGQPPTHPELLEWLAGQFIDSGWSSKAVHRLILNSAAYRQSSASNPVAAERDPENKLLWRMPLRRLDAESIYDALMAVSGDLDLSMGGPATAAVPVDLGEFLVPEKLAGGKRRAVYLQQRRTQVPTFLAVFDAPSIVTNCVERLPSTVPMQSLALLNSEFILTRAAGFAKRVALAAGDDSDARIELAFRLALSREPDADELRASYQFLRSQARHYASSNLAPQRQAWVDFCHSLIASNAFLYIE